MENKIEPGNDTIELSDDKIAKVLGGSWGPYDDIKCTRCGSENLEPYEYADKPYEVFKCLSCGAIIEWNPLVNQ